MTMTLSGSGTIAGLVAGGLPDATITQPDLASGVAGNGPAFCAYLGVNQSISSTTATKVQLATEVFDTNGAYDNATNYRFTPTVAGYYQVNWTMEGIGTSVTYAGAFIYKNGFNFSSGQNVAPPLSFQIASVSNVIYLNGTTDYLEFYAQINATSPQVASGSNTTFASAALVRAA